MILSKKKSGEMLEAAKPLIKWIAENCHPHCTATVDCASVDLAECVANEATDEFLGEHYETTCPNCGEKTALSVGPSIAACRVCMHSWKLPKNMEEDRHASDCATHNGPALPEGPCDCGVEAQGIHNKTSGRILTCVYCGHEYPQDTPAAGDKVLTDHIRICEKHPLRKAEADIAKLRAALVGLVGAETKEELDQMELAMRSVPAPDADKAVSINAIAALRDNMII